MLESAFLTDKSTLRGWGIAPLLLTIVQICDFGQAKLRSTAMATRVQFSTGRLWGTQDYIAPEGIQGKPGTTASDVWSFALTIFSLMAECQPWEGVRPATLDPGAFAAVSIIQQGIRPNLELLPESFRPSNAGNNPSLANLLASMWQLEPEDRPPMTFVVESIRNIIEGKPYTPFIQKQTAPVPAPSPVQAKAPVTAVAAATAPAVSTPGSSAASVPSAAALQVTSSISGANFWDMEIEAPTPMTAAPRPSAPFLPPTGDVYARLLAQGGTLPLVAAPAVGTTRAISPSAPPVSQRPAAAPAVAARPTFNFTTSAAASSSHSKAMSLSDLLKSVAVTDIPRDEHDNVDQGSMNVDLAFCVDCTGSMGSYIKEVVDKVVEIVNTVKAKFQGSEVRVAFVGYRDYSDKERFCIQDFTTAENIKRYVETVKADGGGDCAEDVAGGLRAVGKLSWNKNVARLTIHLADAPAHGAQYHDMGKGGDDYADCLSKDDLLESLVRKLADRQIDYYFISLNKRTKIMESALEKAYNESTSKKSAFTIMAMGDNVSRLLNTVTIAVSSTMAASKRKN